MKQRSKHLTFKRDKHFCGIDIGKYKHVACIIDADGRFVAKSQSFTNDAAGYAQLLDRLERTSRRSELLMAMEATGHYGYGLHDFLTRRDDRVVVLNPVQTAAEAKKGIRKSKTDKIDARHIATIIKNGQQRPAQVPGELGMTCRQLSRLWYALRKQQSRTKQLIRSRLHPVWPEYETFFANLFSTTGLTLLKTAPIPADLMNVSQDDLAELLRKASRGKFNLVQAQRIREHTEASVGMQRGLPGARIGIRTLIAQLEACEAIRKQLDEDINDLARNLPAYLFTLPGINPLRAVSLFGETDPIKTFTEPKQLVAFAGLDPAVFPSGKPDAVYCRISKRGSPMLRHTLWTMTHLAVRAEGELRTYYLRRRRDGLHHLAAVTAAAIKLTRITWRIMTDERDYIPDGRSIPS